MKLFLHTLTQVRIINEPLEWSGTPAEFQALEPTYAGLPSGASVRYQTPDLQYYEDNAGRHDDPLNCLGYCDQVSSYLVSGCVYVHVSLSAAALDVDDPQAAIQFDAHLKMTDNPSDPDLPVSQSWIIRPWHEAGDRDALLFAFVNGACSDAYTYREGIPLGDWWIREEDFNPIAVGGATYRVKLVHPVKYTLYRELT
jgi:hypothetical protein